MNVRLCRLLCGAGIVAVLHITTLPETAAAQAEKQDTPDFITSQNVETVVLEGLPGTIGGWTYVKGSQWIPLDAQSARDFLGEGLADARNGGNGWASGLAFKLRKPAVIRRVTVKRGGPGWLELKSIGVLVSDAESPGKDDWKELITASPDSWPSDGKFDIQVTDKRSHRWWALRFVVPEGQSRGNLSISGITLWTKATQDTKP